MQDRDELIARLRETPRGAAHSFPVEGPRGEPCTRVVPYGNMMNEAADELERLAALESRPAPTEERAREVLAECAAPNDDAGDREWREWLLAKPARLDRVPMDGKTALAAMLRFATDTTPSRDEEGSVDREAIARIIAPHVWSEFATDHDLNERHAALAKADAILALKTSTPETQIVET